MRKFLIGAALGGLAVASLAVSGVAQMPTEAPGKADPSRVTAGTYTIDTNHTLVSFVINHLGFNDYFGLFGGITGKLALDPADAKHDHLSVDVAMSGLTTTNPKLNQHLSSPDFFDVAKFTTAHFESSDVHTGPKGAAIDGMLTLHGVTKPVTIMAKFTGAGTAPAMMGGKTTVGFEGETKIKRSDFGMGWGVPLVGDEVQLYITAAFEK